MLSKVISFAVLLFVALGLSGCATPIMPILSQEAAPEKVLEKNYSINAVQQIAVGEPMIKVKDYIVIKKTSNKLSPSSDFMIGKNYLSGKKGELIPLVGKVTLSDVEYYLIQAKEPILLFPISLDGNYSGGHVARVIGGFHSGNEVMGKGSGNIAIEPQGTKFILGQIEEIDATAGFTNYEIIYTGLTKDAVNFLYREFSPDNLARPAFYQNLTYPTSSKVVRFKKLKMQIIKANEENLSYKVLED
jgi:hypothetical protein